MFDTVPVTAKEAAYALGSTRWEMIRVAVFPHSSAGMIGAVMLGVGRAMGETIAAALVIGSSPQIAANEFNEAGGLHRAALIGLGVELFALTVVVNIAARYVIARSRRMA